MKGARSGSPPRHLSTEARSNLPASQTEPTELKRPPSKCTHLSATTSILWQGPAPAPGTTPPRWRLAWHPCPLKRSRTSGFTVSDQRPTGETVFFCSQRQRGRGSARSTQETGGGCCCWFFSPPNVGTLHDDEKDFRVPGEQRRSRRVVCPPPPLFRASSATLTTPPPVSRCSSSPPLPSFLADAQNLVKQYAFYMKRALVSFSIVFPLHPLRRCFCCFFALGGGEGNADDVLGV